VKLPSKTRDLTEIRISRKTLTEVGHKDGHGWAVSYADLLMVLLSFFIIFFSLEESSESGVKSQMQRIALAMKGENPGKYIPPKEMRLVSLAEVLTTQGLKVIPYPDRVVIDLENAEYEKGEYRLENKIQEGVTEIFKRLEPYKNELHYTIIGHTDTVPLRPRNELLMDNFDLSSLRALRVLKYVVSLGFPENQIAARAASSFDRNSRSISFEIRLKDDKSLEKTKLVPTQDKKSRGDS